MISNKEEYDPILQIFYLVPLSGIVETPALRGSKKGGM